MSQSENIAVIGAGIMGLSIAHALQKTHTVTIYDPIGFPAANASYMAGGLLAPYAEIEHLTDDFINAGFEGIRLWQTIIPALKDKIPFAQKGSLLIAHKEDTYMLDRFAQKLPANQPSKKVCTKEIADLEPALGSRFDHGIYLPNEAQINAHAAMQALANALPKKITEAADPEKLRAQYDWIIDCRGHASPDKNLRGVKGEIITVRNPEFSLHRPVRLMHPRYPFYIAPCPNHEFIIGATLIESADTAVSLKSTLELLSAAYSLHPSFGEAEIIKIQAGIRPAYEDNLPRIELTENIITCNGLFRHGYLLAPVMAQGVKDFLSNYKNEFLHLFMRETNDHHHQRPEENAKRVA